MFWPLLLGAVLFGHAFLTDLHLTPLPPPPGYERAVASLPIRYWVLVRAVQLGPDHKGQSYTSGMIVVSRHAEPHVLVHETMHQVWYADPRLAADWTAAFWPNGRPSGRLESDHARGGPHEDFAEAASILLERGHLKDGTRERWLREHVFLSGEVP